MIFRGLISPALIAAAAVFFAGSGLVQAAPASSLSQGASSIRTLAVPAADALIAEKAYYYRRYYHRRYYQPYYHRRYYYHRPYYRHYYRPRLYPPYYRPFYRPYHPYYHRRYWHPFYY